MTQNTLNLLCPKCPGLQTRIYVRVYSPTFREHLVFRNDHFIEKSLHFAEYPACDAPTTVSGSCRRWRSCFWHCTVRIVLFPNLAPTGLEVYAQREVTRRITLNLLCPKCSGVQTRIYVRVYSPPFCEHLVFRNDQTLSTSPFIPQNTLNMLCPNNSPRYPPTSAIMLLASYT